MNSRPWFGGWQILVGMRYLALNGPPPLRVRQLLRFRRDHVNDSAGVITAVVIMFVVVIFVYGWWSHSRPVHVPPSPIVLVDPTETQSIVRQVEGLESRVSVIEMDIKEVEARIRAISR